MARMIKLTATGPIKIEPQDKPIFICGCGLTKNFPFCDGTHKVCKDEDPDTVYLYDEEGNAIIDESNAD